MAVILPVLALGSMMAIEYTGRTVKAHKLQDAVDAAALMAVRDLTVLITVEGIDTTAELTRVAQASVNAALFDYDVTADVSAIAVDEVTVRVDGSLPATPLIKMFLGKDLAPLKATATAQLFGNSDVCAVSLDKEGGYMLDLNDDSSIQALGCSIYANSVHASAIAVSENATIEAAHICSAGGARGGKTAYTPDATTDCPPIEDPLAHRIDAINGVRDGNCLDSNARHHDGHDEVILTSRRICADLTIAGNSTVSFSPGVYIVDNSVLTFDGQASVKGEDVVFVFTGEDSRLVIGGKAQVNLSGRVSGDFAGFLLISDPLDEDEEMREFTITSEKVERLVGTIYLPGDYLNILTNQKVASESAFTVVMARRMKLHGGAELVLNRDYAATNVPKAQALKNYGGGMRIIE